MVTNQQLNILTKEISDIKLKINIVYSTIAEESIELEGLEKDIGAHMHDNHMVRKLITKKDSITKNLEKNNSIIENLREDFTQKSKNLEILQEDHSKSEKSNKKTSEPSVSEHAIVRYFEKILGYDIEKIRASILDNRVKNLINEMNFEGEYIMEHFTVRIKNKTVVTLYPKSNPKKKPKK